ncbi:hypothetical protein JCM3765_000224 [Sporobolomyces pararoseus]
MRGPSPHSSGEGGHSADEKRSTSSSGTLTALSRSLGIPRRLPESSPKNSTDLATALTRSHSLKTAPTSLSSIESPDSMERRRGLSTSRVSTATPARNTNGSWEEKKDDSCKTEISWMFSERFVAGLRNNNVARGTFGNGTWEISMVPAQPGSRGPTICISAVPQEADIKLATSELAWIRQGTYNFTIRTALVHVSERCAQMDKFSLEHNFSSSNPIAGQPLQAPLQDLLKNYDENKILGIRCTVTAPHRPSPTPSSSNLLLSFFDNPTTTDTVFVFNNEDGPLYVFACKSLVSAASSHFKNLFESNHLTQRVLDIETLDREDRGLNSDLVNGELAPFFRPQIVGDEAGATGDSLNLLSPDQVAPEQQSEVKETEVKETSKEEEISTEERPAKKIKLEESAEVEEQKPDRKLLTVVEVDESDFRSFRAMISYLHVQLVPFYSITSNFLLELAKDRQPGDDFEKYEHCPADWLENHFSSKKKQHYSNNLHPCSPYEMYRLADKYKIEHLKKLSLDYIVRSLTIANVAYELFSPLSLEYKPVSQMILDFFVKNWAEVKKSTAFKAVLDKFSAGELHGRDLMESIFDMMKA